MGVIFEVPVQIRGQVPVAPEMRDSGAGAGGKNADVMGDVGVTPNGIDDNGLDDVFAGVAVNVESEFVIGPSKLAEINWMAGRHVEDEDLKIIRGRIVARFRGRRSLWRGRFCFGGGNFSGWGDEGGVAE